MTRSEVPFYSSDIATLARSLRSQLAGFAQTPGHVELLNMLARAAGSRNYQHYHAKMSRARNVEEPIDHAEVQRLSKYFDTHGRWIRWPKKFSHREPCLWVLWSKLPPRKTLSEQEINQLLLAHHCFEDPALLRREMKERKMVTRTLDGREYRRVERKPPFPAIALIRFLG